MEEQNHNGVRDRILQAALELFSQHGFHATSVRRICEQADANVAGVNYYFRSKEQLYAEVFRYVFEQVKDPVLTVPQQVSSADEWSRALRRWVSATLNLLARDDPPYVWCSRLFARERIDPSACFSMIYERFLLPVTSSLDRLLMMALPADADRTRLHLWNMSIVSQMTVYASRQSPWDKMIFPEGLSREQWLEQMTNHIVEGITSRLHFREHFNMLEKVEKTV